MLISNDESQAPPKTTDSESAFLTRSPGDPYAHRHFQYFQKHKQMTTGTISQLVARNEGGKERKGKSECQTNCIHSELCV